MKGGFTGKILRINLTAKEYIIEDLPEKIARQYLGGAGIGIKYLYDEVPGDTNPLEEDNKLIFVTGPLTGTDAVCASRMKVITKSPLTGAVAMSSTGGYFPAEMKFAGYDMIIVEGKSPEPVYVSIVDDKVTFKDAKPLWGSKTLDCEIFIKDKLGDQNTRVACIGPAGENLVSLGAIINERHAAGRKGTGAVMGSKNLKAIAIRGTKKVPIYDNDKFKEARSAMMKGMKASPVLFGHFAEKGTPGIVGLVEASGVFPYKNFSATGESDLTPYLAEEATDPYNTVVETCYRCPVMCSHVKLAREGQYAGVSSVPEYEVFAILGGATGVNNVDAIIAGDRICDELGMDNMSAGILVGFAMELYEKGILTKEDTDGIDLRFGNHQGMVEVIRKIAFREGIGGILADGVVKAAKKIGKGAEKYAMHVKGLELPGYDPRGVKAHGLNYATSYTGADHNRGYAFQEMFGIPFPYAVDRLTIEGKGELTKWNQDVRCVTADCGPMCAFILDMGVSSFATENTAALVSAATGFNYTPDEVYQVGERVNNVAKLFNMSAGFTRADDTFPDRILEEEIKAGAAKGQRISREDLDFMLDEYYAARGWAKDGTPTKEKLAELDLL